MTETFYDVLGVSEDATTDEIEAAYRERLKETHPDVSDEEDADVATRALIRARDVLVDDGERETYDRLGHEAYVGEERTASEQSTSDVAEAARRAGYGDADTSGPSTATNKRGTNPRDSARERVNRERTANERIRQERQRRARSRQSTDRADSASQSTGATRSQTDGGSPGYATGTGGAWNPSETYTVRQEYSTQPRQQRLIPTGNSLTLLAITFVLYPLLVFIALLPAFPLGVNLIVGFSAILVVAYLQSVPEVALLVFGGWSLLMPLVVVALGFGIFSLPGVLALCSTWFPFGFSILTYTVVSW